MHVVLGVIGGSGVYDIDLDDARWESVSTPWGEPSDEIRRGRLEGVEIAFLPRHGRGHTLTPSDINYRANIYALKSIGVSDILSFSACGSLREELAPGCFVILDQFVDLTYKREKSFFGKGMVAHVSMAAPVSRRLGDFLEAGCKTEGINHHRGGTYITMEGPQFSSLAESLYYRAQGWDVIGMTNMPEAKLAREAEIPYATAAMVTDFDCWHAQHENVEVTPILEVLQANAERSKRLVRDVARRLGSERADDDEGLDTVLDRAIITPPELRDPELLKKLEAITARALAGK
ncbi:MAG: S-methyl-5'-thioadenosine phosphorylase [Hyphomicrobiales bacterium]|nr:S-methyl-5'-thioadenosine phosphorylase [Hyphomicrobiales bacterium]